MRGEQPRSSTGTGTDTIFVTGASGFIGGAVARSLSRSARVVAMSRSEASDERIRANGAEPIRCDLDRISAASLAGVDAVVHCAAWVEPWGRREDYWRANVEGTDRLLAAAREAGVRRFVHMSTEAVLWSGQAMIGIDETEPYANHTPFLYAETKAESERRVLAANVPDAFETIALRPRMVWGPGDTTIAPEAIEMAERGAFAWIDQGRARTSTTHIDNLVHAVGLALTRGRGGEAYFVLDDGEVTLHDFLSRLLAAHGVELPDRSIPSWVARPVAAVLEGTWRALRLPGRPPITRHAVGLLHCDCTLVDAKARRELDYHPIVTREQGLVALAQDALSLGSQK